MSFLRPLVAFFLGLMTFLFIFHKTPLVVLNFSSGKPVTDLDLVLQAMVWSTLVFPLICFCYRTGLVNKVNRLYLQILTCGFLIGLTCISVVQRILILGIFCLTAFLYLLYYHLILKNLSHEVPSMSDNVKDFFQSNQLNLAMIGILLSFL